MTGGDQESEAWGDDEDLPSSVREFASLPIAPIEDIESYFSDAELAVLAYSDKDEVTTRDLTLEMIELRKRRVFLESVLERQQRGHSEETRMGHPRRARYLRD